MIPISLNLEWNSKDMSSFGIAKMGIPTKTVRHLLNNRDGAIKNNIDFQNISCQEFKKWGENYNSMLIIRKRTPTLQKI